LDRTVITYENMWGGTSSEAMEDFTGGVTEIFDLTRPPVDLATVMTKAVERESLMACSINVRYVYDLSNSSTTHESKKYTIEFLL